MNDTFEEYRFSIIEEKPERFKWKIKSAFGIILYDCGYIECPEGMSEALATFILELYLPSFRKTR